MPHRVTTFYDGVQAECFDNVGAVRAEFRDIPGPSPAVEVDAELFYVGTHKGRAYTKDDLRELVANFAAPASEEDWDVPLQVDHSDSAWDTTGSVRKVWLSDNGAKVLGTLRFVGDEAVARAKDRRFRKLSVGIYLQPQKRFREVSVSLPRPSWNLIGRVTSTGSSGCRPSWKELVTHAYPHLSTPWQHLFGRSGRTAAYAEAAA